MSINYIAKTPHQYFLWGETTKMCEIKVTLATSLSSRQSNICFNLPRGLVALYLQPSAVEQLQRSNWGSSTFLKALMFTFPTKSLPLVRDPNHQPSTYKTIHSSWSSYQALNPIKENIYISGLHLRSYVVKWTVVEDDLQHEAFLTANYRWHFNEPCSKFSNIISVLDGLYWSACYSKCLAASPCRAFSFYVEEQKSGPWKDVGRVS